MKPPPNNAQIVDKTGRLSPDWQGWFAQAGIYLSPAGASGTTSQRPVDGTNGVQLFIGQPYYDATLGKPVWVKSRNPTVWADATGASV